MRYGEFLTFPIRIDRQAPPPLRIQVADQICAAIDAGVLPDRMRLPSTRTLGTVLGVSRGVAVAAYDLLYVRGYAAGRRGSGTYVAARPALGRWWVPGDAPERPSASPHGPTHRAGQAPAVPALDLTPGQPCGEVFPLANWRAAWRRASHRPPPAGQLPALGLPALRRAIATHLRLTRGIALAGHEIVVTAGAAPALRLILEALGPCRATVAVEEPVPAGLWRAADEWAQRAGGRITRAASTRPDATGPVVLVGGFTDVLGPTLKLGYALVPADLAHRVGVRIRDGLEQPAYVTQLAVAYLVAGGTVARLTQRLAHIRSRKREVVKGVLGRWYEPAEPDIAGAVRLRLPDGLDARYAALELRRRGLLVEVPARTAEPATASLLLGYAHLDDTSLRSGLARVVGVLEEMLLGDQLDATGTRSV
jgi:GntR family transcriptional regulator/MocR family aminotransferase